MALSPHLLRFYQGSTDAAAAGGKHNTHTVKCALGENPCGVKSQNTNTIRGIPSLQLSYNFFPLIITSINFIIIVIIVIIIITVAVVRALDPILPSTPSLNSAKFSRWSFRAALEVDI